MPFLINPLTTSAPNPPPSTPLRTCHPQPISQDLLDFVLVGLESVPPPCTPLTIAINLFAKIIEKNFTS